MGNFGISEIFRKLYPATPRNFYARNYNPKFLKFFLPPPPPQIYENVLQILCSVSAAKEIFPPLLPVVLHIWQPHRKEINGQILGEKNVQSASKFRIPPITRFVNLSFIFRPGRGQFPKIERSEEGWLQVGRSKTEGEILAIFVKLQRRIGVVSGVFCGTEGTKIPRGGYASAVSRGVGEEEKSPSS